ncbi:MAG: histone deacetylase [Elusimicrobia bacterium]|nr:histone deacetylase [Elusimicrobiota bacterium]
MTIKIFSDLKTTAYESPGHPEAPWRVGKTHERLKAAGLTPQLPEIKASANNVLLAHTDKHWRNVQTGNFEDVDTPDFPGMDQIALISLSGCLSALNSALNGTPAFSLMRPPGHHAAQERVAGFCYVNNMAVACRKALGDGLRVATLDIDVHHGDGTEAIAMGEKNWLFVSLHQSPLYPGTGLSSRSNCVNFPLPPYTNELAYLEALEAAIKRIGDFKPDLLGVSAGFDTYKECPIAQFKLEKETYAKIGRLIAETKWPRFATLEGGYAPDLPVLIENFIKGFDG